MNTLKLSIAAVFLILGGNVLHAQQDSLNREKNIEGVTIQAAGNRKSETAILQDQKKAVIQKQAIGTEEISRKGISNVEQGLTKITGITTVEGRGLFVRGLEERYNYLLINGLGSPSNNPFQKIIALKQFPTDVVGKLNIYKTFNSNLYADFAGATFDIETITLEKPFTKVEFGIGANTRSTFKNNFKISENASGMKGYLGLNAEDRYLPENVRKYRPNGTVFSRNSFQDGWNVDNVTSLPNTSIGFTTAQKIRAGETGSLGILFSLNQSSEYGYREGSKNQFKSLETDIILNNLLQHKQYNYETESSALLGLNFRNSSGTNLNFNAIFLQNVNHIIDDFYGYKDYKVQLGNTGFFRTNQLDISRFLDLQLTGSQKFAERHQVKAGVSYVLNNYQQPDRKILEGSRVDQNNQQLPDDEIITSYGGSNIIRQFLDVNSKFYGSAFAEYSIALGEKREKDYPFQISLGYNGFADLRKNSYRFVFGKAGASAVGVPFLLNLNNPDARFTADEQNGVFYYQEESDAYLPFSNMYQFVNAGYLNLNYKPDETWDILVGGRYENDLSVIRYNRQGLANRETITKDKDFLLPSLTIKKALNEKNNLRFSASKTITRPVLIETMPITYINPDNENIVGNPNILNSENLNLDLKWEMFPTNSETFSVNLFAKQIKNAIERSFVTSGDSNGVTVTFLNAKKATLAGIELEAITKLDKISEVLKNFTFGANATFMYSDVERSAEQLLLELPKGYTEDQLHNRGLQGAAPFSINADLKYEMKNRQNLNRTISLIYNVSGSKIFAVGSAGTDNFYERPFHQLDLVYQEQFTKNWNLKFGIQNMLDQKYQIQLGEDSYIPVNTSGNLQHTDFYRGVGFNMTVGYTF